ncbi:MAG: glycosyltransferase [Acidobacteria bacterium]|nr:glycosyltransferase [Acidobacteriota bacterium]
MPSTFEDRDYVSPGLRVVVPDAHFPHMRAGDRQAHPWKYLRREVPHRWYVDERFPLMGFMNRDEATLLHNIALRFAGRPALEIGAWLGWSTCHLALAGVKLDVIDPAHADPDLRAEVEAALAGCGVSGGVSLNAARSPEGIDELAAARGTKWSLFFIDGDHEANAPERDVRACLPHADEDCAFVLHDLASPHVAAGLRLLEREGFKVLLYQTQQIMGIAWRGRVRPVEHVPDPEVVWQLPHHLVGLPVSGVELGAPAGTGAPSSTASPEVNSTGERAPTGSGGSQSNGGPRRLPDLYDGEAGDWRPSVCVVSNEVVGPFKNGGIGTAMTGLAEHLAAAGCRVTVLYTGAVWSPDVPLERWRRRYAELGIELVALSIEEMKTLAGPVKDCGFGVPFLVYRHLAARHFDVVHFNDCGGEGSLCLAAKRLGLAFKDTLLVLALHSPSRWVLELNHTAPASLLLSAYNYAERLSVKCADVLWSPSRYLVEWARERGFETPAETFVQQYCLPSQRLREQGGGPSDFPEVSHGRSAPPKEIVFFGRLEERKGLRLFCNAVHSLREEFARRGVTVTFLGKAEKCAGMGSLEYIARRSEGWQFPVQTVTNLGQPEALSYLLSGEKLAVMASPVDNSPCTVYEALAWGIPFLAARTGGVPELVQEEHQRHVLFECRAEALRDALLAALDAGGWVAAPAQTQTEVRRVWTSFHADARRYLKPQTDEAGGRRTRDVVAFVEGRTAAELEATLDSLAALDAVRRVVVLNRQGVQLPATAGEFYVRNIDLTVEDPSALDEELERLDGEAVLLIHSGIRVRADAFAGMLAALEGVGADGLQPAASASGAGAPKTVPPLGGDPSFTLFEGATYTGGLLVRAESLGRARAWREPSAESAFAGLADFCVTRGIEIWPHPEAVFEQAEGWARDAARPLPARVQAFDECPPADRYYMLSAGYGTSAYVAGAGGRAGAHRRTVLALIDLGLLPVVRAASWARRRVRAAGSRVPLFSPVERYLVRLLRGNG